MISPLPHVSPHSSSGFLSSSTFPYPSLPRSFLSLLPSFLPLLPLFLRFPPSPLFHIKLFFIEAHAAWNSIPPGAAGWNTRLFWAQAKQMLALGVPPETSLHASFFFSSSLSFHSLSLSFSLCLYLVSPSLWLSCFFVWSRPFFLSLVFLPGLSFSWHFLTLSSLSHSLPSSLSKATS